MIGNDARVSPYTTNIIPEPTRISKHYTVSPPIEDKQ